MQVQLDAVFAPTTTVRQLAALPQWCVVVAGDRKGPKRHEYNVSNVIYLTPEDQEALPFASRRHLRCSAAHVSSHP